MGGTRRSPERGSKVASADTAEKPVANGTAGGATTEEVMKERSRCCCESASGRGAYDAAVVVRYGAAAGGIGAERRERPSVQCSTPAMRSRKRCAEPSRMSRWRLEA